MQGGESVAVLGGDLKEWVALERVATGEKYWIKVIVGRQGTKGAADKLLQVAGSAREKEKR